MLFILNNKRKIKFSSAYYERDRDDKLRERLPIGITHLNAAPLPTLLPLPTIISVLFYLLLSFNILNLNKTKSQIKIQRKTYMI